MAKEPSSKLRTGSATEEPRRGLARCAIPRMGGGDGFAEFTLSEANVFAMTMDK